jgi:hypothetical protein
MQVQQLEAVPRHELVEGATVEVLFEDAFWAAEVLVRQLQTLQGCSGTGILPGRV